MLTKETIKEVTAAEILDAYAESDYPRDWTITVDHFGGTGGSGSSLGIRLLVRDGDGDILRCITGEVEGELAQALIGAALDD